MLPAFCEKCGTMHGKGRPCDPKGLKARSSTVEPSAHNALVASSSLAAPTIIPAHGETVNAADLKSVIPEGSSPSGPTSIPASSSGRTPDFESGNGPEASRQQPFDRTSYQRDYMRDLPKAKAEGLTVKLWRIKHGKDLGNG